jgi:hypothetical protein
MRVTRRVIGAISGGIARVVLQATVIEQERVVYRSLPQRPLELLWREWLG